MWQGYVETLIHILVQNYLYIILNIFYNILFVIFIIRFYKIQQYVKKIFKIL